MTGLAYERLMDVAVGDVELAYTERDSALYALSVGMGRNPLDPAELAFVYEGGAMKSLPTQACVIAHLRPLRDVPLNRNKLVHAMQRVTMHRPLRPSGRFVAHARVVEVCDKGADKGLLITSETTVRDALSGETEFSLISTVFARADGGIGGTGSTSFPRHPLPGNAPRHVVSLKTNPEQALLYRLNGDMNPLHADPAYAGRAGFPRPVLHGLCTFGIACRSVVHAVCSGQPSQIREFEGRFSAPVFPGETLRTEIWDDGEIVSFRVVVEEREVVALDNGRCTILPQPGMASV